MTLGQAYQTIGDFDRAAELLRWSVEAADREPGTPRYRRADPVPGAAGAELECARSLRRGPAPRGGGAPPRHAGRPRGRTHRCSFRCPLLARPPVSRPRGPGARHPGVRPGLTLCRASGSRSWLSPMAAGLGYAYALQGRLAEGRALLEEAIREDISTGALRTRSRRVAWLSEVCRLAGRGEEAWQHAYRALALARQLKERGNEAFALYQRGVVQAHAAPRCRASRSALPAGARPGRGAGDAPAPGPLPPRPGHAVCHHRPGGAGSTALSTASEMYRDMEMTFWLPETEAALAQIETR